MWWSANDAMIASQRGIGAVSKLARTAEMRPRRRRSAIVSIPPSSSMPIMRAPDRDFSTLAASAPEPVPRSTTAGLARVTRVTATAASSIRSR